MNWLDGITSLTLGQSTNLLDGYKASVYLNQIDQSPIKPSKQPALHKLEAHVRNPNYKASWSLPVISLHATKEELATAVMQIKCKPELFEEEKQEGGGVALWPTGALLIQGVSSESQEQALSELSKQIGVDLTKQDESYVLVRRTRVLGQAIHPNYETGEFRNIRLADSLTSEAFQAIKKLNKLSRCSTEVNLEGARGYLNFYNTFGTHFISGVQVGDALFQVFSYKKDKFEYLEKVYSENPQYLSGPDTQLFAVYTSPRTDEYGYRSGIGNIIISSQDPMLAKTIQENSWYDNKHALNNSIFTPQLHSESININKAFRKNTAISIVLNSINVFAEYYRKLIWRRVFKSSMYCKYWHSPNVAPYFSNNCPYDFDELYKKSDIVQGDGLLSTLATPTISIFKEKIDLGSIQFQFRKTIKVLTAFSNAMQIPANITSNETVQPISIEVPGSSLVTLISHIISVPSMGKHTVKLVLSDSAFASMKENLFCGEFYGGLHVTTTDGKKSLMIVNGLIYEEKNGAVEIFCDTRVSPPSKLLEEYFNDLQFSLISAEARLGYLVSTNVTSTTQSSCLKSMGKYLSWLGGMSSEKEPAESNPEIIALRARAIYLAALTTKKSGPGLPIPFLNYEAYRDTIDNVKDVLNKVSDNIIDFQNQILARKEEERRIQSEQAINENILKTGKLLEEYIRAQATLQQSMSAQFNEVFEEKKKNIEELQNQEKKLNTMLSEQRTSVKTQVDKYKQAVEMWKDNETLNVCLSIASSLFAFGFAFETPSSAIVALESLGKMAQRIQKAVNVFDTLIAVYKEVQQIPKNPQMVIDALEGASQGLDSLSTMQWDELKINMDACLNNGPPINAKNDLSAAFAVLVLRGKALIQVQNQLQSELCELAAASRQARTHEEQMKRLNKLHINFQAKPSDLDIEAIDLVGLTGSLLFFQRQMMLIMASTVVIQDRALQYEYLRPPTQIKSFNMIDLQLAILAQSQSINQGLTVQPTPQLHTGPIIYEIHGVPSNYVINNNRYTFEISFSAKEFAMFNYVRVDSLRVEVGGIQSTKSGKYYSELYFLGDPFYDRGFDGEPLTFQTTQRMYTTLNRVTDSSHSIDESNDINSSYPEDLHLCGISLTGGPYEGKITRITPFSKWQLTLPATQSNEEIQFDKMQRGLTIRIIFTLFAQLKETTRSQNDMIKQAQNLRTFNYLTLPDVSGAQYLFPPKPLQLMSVKTDTISVTDILQYHMSNQSVCMGWDVIFSMDVNQINKNLSEQFLDRENNGFFRKTEKVQTEPVKHTNGYSKTTFQFTFDSPRLQFSLNNSKVCEIYFPIVSGFYEKWIKKDSDSDWFLMDNIHLSKDSNNFLKGSVPLSTLQGTVTHDVGINLKQGAFTGGNLVSHTEDAMFDSQLTGYFQNLPDNYAFYTLGTLDLSNYTLLSALTPTSFKFAVRFTQSNRKFLQLFIVTTGDSQVDTQMNLLEPVPNIYECSLIISSRIFFSNVLPPCIDVRALDFTLKTVEPENDVKHEKAWGSEIEKGEITTHFDPKRVGSLHRAVEFYLALPDDTMRLNLASTQFVNGDEKSNWEMKMVTDKKKDKTDKESKDTEEEGKEYTFKYGSRESNIGTGYEWSSIGYGHYKIRITPNLVARLELVITGKGQNQKIKLNSQFPPDSDFETHIDSGGCKCDDDSGIKNIFFSKYKEKMEPKLKSMLDQPFPSISLFALKNILFPSKNIIDLKEVYVPGDLIIFGNFTKSES